jgi:hypothetical protein
MRRVLLVALTIGLLLPAQNKKTKQPELEILQIQVRRINDELIGVDGSVRNSGLKPIAGLRLVFEFFAPGKQSITIQKGSTEPDQLAVKDVAEFHLQLRAPARAVQVTVQSEDESGRELRTANTGPFAVE